LLRAPPLQPLRYSRKSLSRRTVVHAATSVVRVSGLNVHSSPAIGAQVVTVVSLGQHLQVLDRHNGWIKVRTPSGVVGWVKASLTSGARHTAPTSPPATPAYQSVKTSSVRRTTTYRTFASGPHLTAGVRVHVAPGMAAKVLTTAAAGTHVQVLGHSGAWALIRLPSGMTGYVFGIYVHR
jgi:uncharacterized protein YgiM (DUF1202 family)